MERNQNWYRSGAPSAILIPLHSRTLKRSKISVPPIKPSSSDKMAKIKSVCGSGLYAVGPGGLFGMGLGQSRQKFFYLPEPQTDFIFAILSEELGFIGGTLILLLFSVFAAQADKRTSVCFVRAPFRTTRRAPLHKAIE